MSKILDRPDRRVFIVSGLCASLGLFLSSKTRFLLPPTQEKLIREVSSIEWNTLRTRPGWSNSLSVEFTTPVTGSVNIAIFQTPEGKSDDPEQYRLAEQVTVPISKGRGIFRFIPRYLPLSEQDKKNEAVELVPILFGQPASAIGSPLSLIVSPFPFSL